MSKEITAVILAGGRGIRMGALTVDRQKCLLLVDGRLILEHVLHNLQLAFGSARVIIATGYKGESIRRTFGTSFGPLRIEYVGNTEPLETRRRLLLASPLIREPFLCLAGDVIAPPALLRDVVTLYSRIAPSGTLGVLAAAADHRPALSHSIITASNGYVTQLIYPPSHRWRPDQLREMGVAFYDPRFMCWLAHTEPDRMFLSEAIAGVLSEGGTFGVEEYRGTWYHFVRPEELRQQISFEAETY